jgi:hypothetical protein
MTSAQISTANENGCRWFFARGAPLARPPRGCSVVKWPGKDKSKRRFIPAFAQTIIWVFGRFQNKKHIFVLTDGVG